MGVPCAECCVNINVIFSLTREEKAVGREVFYALCVRVFLSQLSKDNQRPGLYIFLRPNLKVRSTMRTAPSEQLDSPFH